MKHSTELEPTVVPRDDTRLRAYSPWSVGNPFAFAGAVAPCTFSLRIVRAAGGNGQMRRRAFVMGGDS